VRRWWGLSVHELPASKFALVLDELRDSDEEHESVTLEHESGWTLSYGRLGNLVLEQVESDDPESRFHQNGVSPDYVLALWERLARGEVERVREEPWAPGHG
jgi:hypothetical protein